MKNRKYFPLLLTALILLLLGGVGMYYYKTHYISAQWSRASLPEISGNLNRPECGWYQLYAYSLQPNIPLSQEKLYINPSDEDGYSYRLALVEFNLSAYADRELDDMAKKNIKRVFQLFTATNMKLIVRFLYDWDGNGEQNEPSDFSLIQNHITQAAEVLNRYQTLIYTTQGIFVGSWGEMHHSKYLSKEQMTSLLLTYAKATEESIPLAVRTPSQYETILQELESHPDLYQKYGISTEQLKKRLGLFNDGLLGSASDLGTYPQVDAATTKAEKEHIRQEMLEKEGEIALQAPFGGEAVGENQWSDGNSAAKDFATMHISYLNQIYDSKTIARWKTSPFTEQGLLYQGKTWYDYITDHLGARFVIEDCTFRYQPFQKGDAAGVLFLTNKGFSKLYSEKEFSLCLIHTKTKKKTILLSTETMNEQDKPTQWLSGETVQIPFSFSPFDLEDGEYELIVALKDPNTGEIISFANDGFLEEEEGYLLGSITIHR